MFGDDLDSIPEPAVQSVANSAGGGGGTETTTAVAVATTTTTTQSHRLFLRTIPIATTVSDTQFTAYLVAAFLSIAMFVFLNASQAFVLGQIVQIPSNGLGDASGSLTFYDELCSLVLVFCWGVLSDVWGRGVVYSAGFLWMGVGLALFTYAWNLYPSLLLFRIVFAVGGSAASAMLTAVLSDYAVDQGRGRVSALVGMASGSGALLALFGFLRIPVFWGDDEVMGLRWTYWIVAGISFGVAFLMAGTMINWGKIMGVLHSQQQPPASSSPLGFDDDFVVVHTDHNSNNNINVSSSPAAAVGGSSSSHPAGTCPALKLSSTSKTSSASSSNSSLDSQVSASAPLVPHHSSSTSASVATPTARPPSLQNCPAYKKSKSFTPILIDGLLAIRDPRVLLGYIGGFLARGDTIIITLFLPLWVYKFYIDKGLCEGGGGHHVPDIKLKCHEAYILASKLSGIAQTLALIAAPLFGYLSDRFYRPLATLLAASLGAIGYMALFSLKDPESRVWGPVIVSIIGVAEIGMVVCSMALVTGTYVPASSKGAVSGVYSVFGAAGILLSTKIGGVLFDSWDQGGPFFVMGVMHIVCVLASILVISGDVRRLLTKQRTTSSSAGSNEDAAEEQSSRVHGSLLRRLKLLENEVILKR